MGEKVAVLAGVGPGTGAALARKLSEEGCRVALLARSSQFITELQAELTRNNKSAIAIPTDISDEQAVADAFARTQKELGPVEILINHASAASWKPVLEITPAEFEKAWRVAVYGAFLCTKAVLPSMLKAGQGALLFTGATSAIRGRKGAPAFSSAKFALRGLAWSLAAELWPRGIHVAHIVIDGMIDTPTVRRDYSLKPDDPLLNPEHIAESYWHLISQKGSAWTFELDLRPHGEEFFT